MELVSNQKRFLRAAGLLTTAYLCAALFGLPLIFTNFYFNITETKQAFYLISSGVYLFLLLMARIVFPPDYGVKSERMSLHPAVIALAAFFAVSVVGALLSQYPNEVFWGDNNRYQGLLTLACYVLVAAALSFRAVDLRWPIRALVLAASLAGIAGLLQHFGFDPIGFFTDLREADRGRFISTLGNADFYGGFIVMAFAVTLGFYLNAETRRMRSLAFASFVCVSFGALVAGSDSAALGLIVCALLFPVLLFSSLVAMRRFMIAGVVFFGCAFLFGLLSRVLDSVTYLSFFTISVSRAAVSLSLAGVALVLWLVLRRTDQERLLRLKKVYGIVLAVLFVLIAVTLILLNTAFKSVSIGELSRYLRFDESWGTDRGKIWSFVMRFYGSLSPAQKLFGAGSGALFHADAIHPLFSDASLDTAHNEYLQYLVTNGALGLACYLSALVFAVRSGIRKCAAKPEYCGVIVAVVAYAVQAAVNIAQPASTPLFFLLLAVQISRTPDHSQME